MSLEHDLLEDSSNLYHKEVAKVQLQEFEDFGLARRAFDESHAELHMTQGPSEELDRQTNSALKQEWQFIRQEAYRKIALLMLQKDARDANIRVFVKTREDLNKLASQVELLPWQPSYNGI